MRRPLNSASPTSAPCPGESASLPRPAAAPARRSRLPQPDALQRDAFALPGKSAGCALLDYMKISGYITLIKLDICYISEGYESSPVSQSPFG